MHDAVMLFAVLLAGYMSFAGLAVAQERNWRRAGGENRPSTARTLVLRIAGAAGLILALVAALVRDGPSFGALLWITSLSLSALAVTATLTWRAHWLRLLAAGAGSSDRGLSH